MKLIPVNEQPNCAAGILYELLAERTAEQSISHRQMPTWDEHLAFIESKIPTSDGLDPYSVWDLIEVDGRIVGAIYLTLRDEIGVAIFKKEQRKGYGSAAVKLLMELSGPLPYLANVNPHNAASIVMWEKLGFVHIQNTYRLEAA
jgi:RimJ/RimL family protein N-acetyltransferase